MAITMNLRILMLGNSFIFVNDLPSILADLTGAEVVHHTRGGARLAEQLNPATKMGGLTQAALQNEKWDYVILQEMSNGPITSKEKFLKNASALCDQIRANGATPILYATWAYQKGSEQLASFGMDYDEMFRQMYASYHEAAEQTGALIADVGEKFYELSEIQDLYAEDGCHPNEAGSRLAAETIAEVIKANQARMQSEEEAKNPDKQTENEKKTIVELNTTKDDIRLRILYLYQLLLTQTDEEHPLSSKQIMDKMKEMHNISMHRTTVPSDIALLRAAGLDIVGQRRRAWEYYLADRTFSIPELKLLIDAVQSSKFITEKKSRLLIEKLTSLTSNTNAEKLKRTVHISGRVKSDNEKGYYIVDTINEAINAGVKISFLYFELDGKKRQVPKNDGKPYTVSPFDLIWDGDYYYLTGYCDERESVRTFRVDRIMNTPDILADQPVEPRPETYDVSRYTTEAFRMFTTDEAVEVSLLCDNVVMKSIVDKFGMGISTKSVGEDKFRVKVKVCTGPTFYRWVFGSSGKIKIEGPEEVRDEYREMLKQALDEA